jgi:hypothetical protein
VARHQAIHRRASVFQSPCLYPPLGQVTVGIVPVSAKSIYIGQVTYCQPVVDHSTISRFCLLVRTHFCVCCLCLDSPLLLLANIIPCVDMSRSTRTIRTRSIYIIPVPKAVSMNHSASGHKLGNTYKIRIAIFCVCIFWLKCFNSGRSMPPKHRTR